ncbi:MAG TPA: DUF1847 domain-containing protein [Anaerovoracaceae bacterium]|nr:DUF1847 domain-containing protein [Anaerovoracaceae bacterium]
MYTCGHCTKQVCETGELEKAPTNCPCRDDEIKEKSRAKYSEEENKMLLAQSARTEAEGYCKRTRIEEVMEFAEHMGYRKLGIAHCVGFVKEAGIASKIFKANGFSVDTVCCKCSLITKEEMGIGEWQLDPGYEGICNPIGQAMALEKAECDLAIVMGLCVGHDTLFIKHCNLPVTYLVTKDRVTGHNPVAAIYLSESYYHDKLYNRKKGDK